MGWTLFLELPADGKFTCPRMIDLCRAVWMVPSRPSGASPRLAERGVRGPDVRHPAGSAQIADSDYRFACRGWGSLLQQSVTCWLTGSHHGRCAVCHP